jgi:hypothetical protein
MVSIPAPRSCFSMPPDTFVAHFCEFPARRDYNRIAVIRAIADNGQNALAARQIMPATP